MEKFQLLNQNPNFLTKFKHLLTVSLTLTLSFTLSHHTLVTVAQIPSDGCLSALLPFQNARIISEPEPFFACFTCARPPLKGTSGAANCADGDVPELNITVSCSALCQQQISDVETGCAEEIANPSGNFRLLDRVGLTSIFFSRWGSCDFGYNPSQCDRALQELRTTLADATLSDICGFRIDQTEEDGCASACRTRVEDVLFSCQFDTPFLVLNDDATDIDPTLTLGTVANFRGSSLVAQTLVWDNLHPACKTYALSIAGDFENPTNAPTTRTPTKFPTTRAPTNEPVSSSPTKEDPGDGGNGGTKSPTTKDEANGGGNGSSDGKGNFFDFVNDQDTLIKVIAGAVGVFLVIGFMIMAFRVNASSRRIQKELEAGIKSPEEENPNDVQTANVVNAKNVEPEVTI